MKALCSILCWLGFHNMISVKGKHICAACRRELK